MTATLHETGLNHEQSSRKSAESVLAGYVVSVTTNESALDSRNPRTSMDEQVLSTLEHTSDHSEDLSAPEALCELAVCARSVGITDYVRSKALDKLIDDVPAIRILLQELHMKASEVLETHDDISDSRLVESLGLASDLTQDRHILEETLDKLEDTAEHTYDASFLAIETALEKEVLYVDAIRVAKKEAQKRYLEKIVPPSQRPDRDEDDPYLFLSRNDHPTKIK